MSLGESIHAARKAAGLSQEALGERLGVVSQTVSKWERGESAPDAMLLPTLADTLGVSLDALFERTPGDEAMETGLLAWLRPKTDPERTEAMLRLNRRQLELSIGIIDGRMTLPQIPKEVRYAWLGENDLSFYRSHLSGPVSFIFREPEAGWETLFEDPERFRALWEALGDGEALGAAKKILSMPCNGIVARPVLDKLLGLAEPGRTIPLLMRLNLLHFDTRIVDGRETEICFLTPDPAVLALLTLARLFYDPERGETEMYVTGGGWNFRPPLYRNEWPADLRDWWLDADLL
jgi:transcriptional regulator with XRE-family HTH domain